jgi:hypothetical protein
MNDALKELNSLDNGGRRSGGDRRNYSYTLHIPERRIGKERRSGKDRRKSPRIKGYDESTRNASDKYSSS